MIIREITSEDFDGLMTLYTYLHDNPVPEKDEHTLGVWNQIISDDHHHIIVAEEDGQIISSCVCVIIPNLTKGQRPYAFVENVVTHPDHRKRGAATACLERADSLAKQAGCYKLMLLTGSKEESTLNFYERAGYNRKDKTGFIKWI